MTYFELYSTLFKRLIKEQFPEYKLIQPYQGFLPTTWGRVDNIQRAFDKILGPYLSQDIVRFFRDKFEVCLTTEDIKYLEKRIYDHSLSSGLGITATRHNISSKCMSEHFKNWFVSTTCENF